MDGMEHLTHGWEPDLDPGDSLVRRFILTNADSAMFMAAAVKGRSERWDDLVVTDPASPIMFDNFGLLLQPPPYTDMDDVVRRLTEFFPPERHFVFLSAWPTPDLSGAGFSLMGHPPFMLRPPGGTPPPLPHGLRIAPVTDRATLDDFVNTIVTGYPMPGTEGTALSNPAILEGPIRLFVGYADGRPVATSGARIGHGIVDVEWVSTLPAYRRRGFGAALTWAATRVSPEDPAVLIASDDGQPVYEAMGYLRLMRFTIWHRPPSDG